MARIPITRRVSLGAGTLNDQNLVTIPAGAQAILFNPQTVVTDVQMAFNRDDVNATGRFATLQAGQPLELRTNAGEYFPDLQVTLFASAAVNVDLIWW